MSDLSQLAVDSVGLCEAAAIPYKALHDAKYHSGLTPLRPPVKGKRSAARYSLMQTVAIRIARLLDRKFGVAVPDMSDLVSRLWNMAPGELLAEFREGRTCCVVVGRSVCAELFPPTAVNDFDAYLRANGHSAPVVAISVEQEFGRALERIQGSTAPEAN